MPDETLRDVLAARETTLDSALQKRALLRDELRTIEQQISTLELHVRALREIRDEVTPEGSVSSIWQGREPQGTPSLAGLPRTRAIEIILTEAGGEGLHRSAIWQRLCDRGFPGEQLGDTSAALAYLKRTGRARNTGRGIWASPNPNAATA